MIKTISRFLLRLMGWRIREDSVPDVRKAVILVAPHTSNKDFLIGRLAFNMLDIKAAFLIKKEAFFFPVGGILRKIGGVPVSRNRKTNLVDQLSRYFSHSEELMLVVTPEGTRSYVKKWKRGFYYIALKANVPIILSYIDYARKEGGMGKVIYPSGDIEKDFAEIVNFYQGITARYPEDFCPQPVLR
ncbi:MAG: lysophospholipid acyltransferase family protein [Bacteroidales bacterium]|nr:lysophospholipid acyltransferase family protein [Bacteroidales bacterium]MCF8332853.1 lysophospholipid acyltransferase family protein [Bacteroidales bacterium]